MFANRCRPASWCGATTALPGDRNVQFVAEVVTLGAASGGGQLRAPARDCTNTATSCHRTGTALLWGGLIGMLGGLALGNNAEPRAGEHHGSER
jgi:hypothetical protein